MKIILFLFLIPAGLFAQDIPKGATKVIITNELSAKENFAHAVKILLDNDYFFDQRDTSIWYIKTQAKKVNKWTGLYFLNIRAIENRIELSGMFKTGIEINTGIVTMADEYEVLQNKGAKNSIFKLAFDQMNSIASKLSGSKSYQ